MDATIDQAVETLRQSEPFRHLTEGEWDEAMHALDTSHYAAGEIVLDRWTSPRALYVVSEGAVEERDGTGIVARHGSGKAFDYKALLEGRTETSFVARESATCHLLPAALLTGLMRRNRSFRDGVRTVSADKVDALLQAQQRREAGAFLLAAVGDGPLHRPLFVPPHTTVAEAVGLMKAEGSSSVLVRRGARVGIFTGRDVRERLVLARLPETTPIGDLASYDLITLDHDDFVFNALATMTSQAVRHLVIKKAGDIVGIFEQADLLSYINDSSYAIAHYVDRAQSRDELKEAGQSIPRLIRLLYERGTRPRHIARMVSDLNRKLFRRLYEQIMPADLQDQACLVMLGSEGRGEQLLRTDQDNAIIFRDPIPRAEIQAPLKRITEALIELGYPPCRGGVMVSNPAWSKSVGEYERLLRAWVAQADATGLMNLAIFYDASAVAGDLSLLDDLKSYLMERLREGTLHMGYFARPILSFETPLGLFKRFRTERTGDHKGELDLKKGGIFPIVHGIRSLSLEHSLRETNTITRIQILKTQGVLSNTFAADLIEAFDFMSMLRLRTQLAQLDAGKSGDNYVRPAQLANMERNLLRLSFETIDQLKYFLKEHFKLYLVS